MKGPHRSAPWVVQALVRLLPEETRAAFAEPLEATVAETLAAASERGRATHAWAVSREVAALVALVLREHVRAPAVARREGWGTTLGPDLRAAMRGLARNPGTTMVCVGTLAVGIGSVSAIYSVMGGVLVRNLSYADPERVLYIGETTPEGDYTSVSYENFRDWQDSGVFAAVGATLGNSVAVTGDGTPERIRAEFVSSSYFDVIGIRPVLGRSIEPGEDRPGGPRTAVLSWAWWQQRFGADPLILGRVLLLNNEPHTVVGVMPAGFRSPWDTPQAWISLHSAPTTFDRTSRGFQAVLALRRPGQSAEAARESLVSLAAGLAEEYPEANAGRSAWAFPLGPFLADRDRPFLLGLAVAVGLLLLIACANVANLQLARSAARKREMAVRMALGGGRWRLARLLLVENGALFLVGGLAGLGVAWLGVQGLLTLQPHYSAYYDVHLDLRAVAMGLGLAVVTGLVFGSAPVREALRTVPGAVLREGDRGGGEGRGAQHFRSALVITQMALSMSLLVGAGLLARTMSALLGVDPGFDQDRLLTLEFRLPENRYETEESRRVFFDRLMEELDAVQGVERVGLASDLPFSGNGGTTRLLPEGSAVEWGQAPRIRSNTVSPEYRATMGISLLEGRDLSGSDLPGGPIAVLVSESLATRYFKGGALGRHLYATPDRSVSGTIVGVVADVRTSLTEPPEPYVYLSYRQAPTLFMSVAVRTLGEPMGVAGAVRDAVWRVDPDQPVWEVMPITERMAGSASDTRFNAILVAVFAATALILAMLGLYGVMSYSVRQRERELGVRLALGAEPAAVVRLVLKRGVGLTAAGLGVGVLLGAGLAEVLRSLLFGVPALDPLTFGGAALSLGCMGVAAAYLPARRALRLDPTDALH